MHVNRFFSRDYFKRTLNALTAAMASQVYSYTRPHVEFSFSPAPMVTLNDVRLRYDWKEGGNILGMDVNGPWEARDIRLVLRFLKAGGVFYDVGANIGWFALNVAVHCQGVRVVCFEPFCGPLRANLALNNAVGVELIEVALGDRDSTVVMTSALKGYNHIVEEYRNTGVVPLKPLDILIEERQLPDPTFIKMDIEGFEFFALKGGQRMLRRARPIILCEINGLHKRYGVTVDMLLDLFDFLGYCVCLVDEDFCLQPIPRKKLPDVLQIPSVCQNVVLCPAEGIKV